MFRIHIYATPFSVVLLMISLSVWLCVCRWGFRYNLKDREVIILNINLQYLNPLARSHATKKKVSGTVSQNYLLLIDFFFYTLVNDLTYKTHWAIKG